MVLYSGLPHSLYTKSRLGSIDTQYAVSRNQWQRQCRSKVGPNRDYKKSLLTLPWQQNIWMITNGKFTQKENSHCFKKENEIFCVVFTYPMKGARGIRKFHIAVMQRWVKCLMYVQSCCFVNINLRIFLPFLLPSPWSLQPASKLSRSLINFHFHPGNPGTPQSVKTVTANVPQIRKVTTACQVSLDSRGRVELFIYKSLSQQH